MASSASLTAGCTRIANIVNFARRLVALVPSLDSSSGSSSDSSSDSASLALSSFVFFDLVLRAVAFLLFFFWCFSR